MQNHFGIQQVCHCRKKYVALVYTLMTSLNLEFLGFPDHIAGRSPGSRNFSSFRVPFFFTASYVGLRDPKSTAKV